MSETLQQRFRVARIIALAHVSSILIIAGVGVFVVTSASPAPPPKVPEFYGIMRLVLYAAALISQVIYGVIASRYRRRAGTPDEVSARLGAVTVAGLAVAESPVAFGLVLALLSHDLTDLLILGGGAFFLCLGRWPHAADWEEVEREATRTTVGPSTSVF